MVDRGARFRRINIAGMVALVAATLAGGCGGAGANHEGDKSAAAIFSDARAATAGASSVRVAGSGSPGGTPLRLDIVAGRGVGGGSITTGGATLQLVLGAAKIYLRGDEASLQKLIGDANRAHTLANTWLETNADSAALAGLGDLLTISRLPAQFTVHGTLSKGPPTRFNGMSVLPLRDTSTGGEVYVALDGKPYIEGVRGASGPGAATIAFSQYGSARPPAIPAHSRPLDQATGP